MNKFLTNTTKKVTLLSIILAVILVAGIVLGAIFGFNKSVNVKDAKTLTVSMNSVIYETEKETVNGICKDAFDGLSLLQVKEGKMDGVECEIMYVFEGTADLTAAKESLEKSFAEKTANGAAWETLTVTVSTGEEVVLATQAEGYVLRGVIAGLVFAALALVYVGLRYRWDMGFLTCICVALGIALTTALIAACRIPVTNTVMYAIAGAGLLTAIMVMFTLNKLRPVLAEKKKAENMEIIVSAVAVKEILWTAILVAFGVVLVGALSGTTGSWFMVSALVGLLTSAFIGMIYAPALYLPFMERADKVAADNAKYKGAKKGEKKPAAATENAEEQA